ncbi:hypothetical protein [Salinivibrio kushneri]|uniref:hypothetical protein n=1 Tax=Salinivibrio kushneri TaxID=1908198 RepID=UPI0018E3E4BD|nr:hypothetical protein [Salinivibrio kushneri]
MSILKSGVDIHTIVSDFLLPQMDAHDITNTENITVDTTWYALQSDDCVEVVSVLEHCKVEGFPCIETHVGTFIGVKKYGAIPECCLSGF